VRSSGLLGWHCFDALDSFGTTVTTDLTDSNCTAACWGSGLVGFAGQQQKT
jgi:hypothetical protein